MIQISISDGCSKSVDLHFDSTSISMISRFLHFITFADNSLYLDSSPIQKNVSEFYDSNYDSFMIQDAKLLKNVLDYAVDHLL